MLDAWSPLFTIARPSLYRLSNSHFPCSCSLKRESIKQCGTPSLPPAPLRSRSLPREKTPRWSQPCGWYGGFQRLRRKDRGSPGCRCPLSPPCLCRRDLPPLLHGPGHRWHRHSEEHGAVQHGRHRHVCAGHRQVAAPALPHPPRPAAGKEGRASSPEEKGPGRPRKCPRGACASAGPRGN